MKTKIVALMFALPLLASVSQANSSLQQSSQRLQGTNSGGGGNASCAEYSDLLGKVAYSLNQLGQREASKSVSIINVASLWEIKRSLKCLPVLDQPRTAYSVPKTRTTTLLYKEWDLLTLVSKVRLVVHELAVLAEYEGDGEYFVSEDIMKLLSEKTKFLTSRNCEIQELTGDEAFGSEGFTILAQKGYVISRSKSALRIGVNYLDSVGCGNTGCRYQKYSVSIYNDGDYRKGSIVPPKEGKIYENEDLQDLILSQLKKLPACN